MTETTSGRTFLSSPGKAARESDFYRIESPDVDPHKIPPLLFETLLGQVEGKASSVIHQLAESGDPESIDSESMAIFVWFMGLQATRGRAFRDRMRASTNALAKLQHPKPAEQAASALSRRPGVTESGGPAQEVAEFARMLHADELVVAPQDAALVLDAADAGYAMGTQFFWRDWHVYGTGVAHVITSDEPVIPVDGEATDRRRAAGFGTADVVLFPLTPTALLAMFHPDFESWHGRFPELLTPSEVFEVNREVAASSHRWVFESPGRRATLGMGLPPPQPPVLQDGPLPILDEPDARLYVTFVPSRWYSSTTPAPAPVARWWGSDPRR